MHSKTKTLLIVAAALALIYFLYKGGDLPIPNEGEVELENALPENMDGQINSEAEVGPTMGGNDMDLEHSASNKMPKPEGKYNNVHLPREDMNKYFPQRDYAPPESDWLYQKFNSRNKAKRGYKRSSYSGAVRGALGPSDWDEYFDYNNNVIGGSQTGENDKFLPIDETNGNFAVFKSLGRSTCGSNQNCEPEDLFDVDKYLPQEVNDDWFEVQPEPISVKNRHLINITKPIGVNTIGTSLRNASYDIRGTYANPKMVVSPWLQSSIESDTNLKPLL